MLVHGRPIPLEEIVQRIERVTVDSTRAAGRTLLERARPAIAAIGPARGLDGAAKVVDSLSRRAA